MSLKKVFNRPGIPIYPWYISDLVLTKDIQELTNGQVVKKVFFYTTKKITTIYYDLESTNILGTWLLDKIIKDHKFYHLVINKIYYYSKELLKFSTELKELDLDSMSNRDLLKLSSQYEKKLGKLRIWGWMPPILDGIFEPFLSNYILEKLTIFLKAKKQISKIADYYSLLSSSERMSEVQIESLARLKLLLVLKNNKKYLKAFQSLNSQEFKNWGKRFPQAFILLNKHLQKFGWLTYAYTGPAMNLDYLLKNLFTDLKKAELEKQIRQIIQNFNTIKARKIKLQHRLKLPKDLIYLLAVSSKLMSIKDYRKGIYQRSYLAMDSIVAELAKRLKLKRREVRCLVLDEIKDALLKHRENIYRYRAQKRLNLSCYLVQEGKIKVLEGLKAKKMITKIKSLDYQPKLKTKNIRELPGLIAYAGVARGTVKIVLTKNDLKKMEIGDILVSSATNPDLISAMQKAAAFVTDTGGIICHAAIVAREMKKPCVIGTKIATQILHDGDQVEVNANRGIVRKI